CRLGNAIRKAAAGTISGSKYSLLVLGQWCCLYATVVTVGIDFGYVDREPFFEFRAGHDGPAFRIIIALLFNIGKCRTFEPASPSYPSPEAAFDVAAVSRFSRRSVFDGDIVILARATNHCASKLLCVVAVDRAHLSPAGPLGLHADAGEPVLL